MQFFRIKNRRKKIRKFNYARLRSKEEREHREKKDREGQK